MEALAFVHYSLAYEDPEAQPQLRSLEELNLAIPSATLVAVAGGVSAVSIMTTAPNTHAAVQRGDACPAVQTVQQALEGVGRDPGPIDGVFGAKTEYAIIRFQEIKGLAPDGVVDTATAADLGLNPNIACDIANAKATASPSKAGKVTAKATRLVLKRGERKLYVYNNKVKLASYPVAVGKPGWETPTGTFKVTTKLKNPGWTHPLTREILPPGPENPLGDRWIEIWTDGYTSIGFHGTPKPKSVGDAVSHGCIRMYNEDIRDLYEMVALGTSVVVE